jgi:bifunctional pyridoxal-dependent enzyme with beta-cystathionase and maltose regulon repressor activities
MPWNFDEPVDRENSDCIKYDLRKETFGARDIIPMWVADMDFKNSRFRPSFLEVSHRKTNLANPECQVGPCPS